MRKICYLSFVIFFLWIVSVCKAEIFSIAVAKGSKEAWRKKEGDIIAVMPEGHLWGSKELLNFIIVKVDFGTEIRRLEDCKRLMVPLFEEGSLIETGDSVLNIIGKRRFNISFPDLEAKALLLGHSIDLERLRQVKEVYQPFLDENIPIVWTDMVYDKYTRRKVIEVDLGVIKNLSEDPNGRINAQVFP